MGIGANAGISARPVSFMTVADGMAEWFDKFDDFAQKKWHKSPSKVCKLPKM